MLESIFLVPDHSDRVIAFLEDLAEHGGPDGRTVEAIRVASRCFGHLIWGVVPIVVTFRDDAINPDHLVFV